MAQYTKKSNKLNSDIDINLLAELISEKLSKNIQGTKSFENKEEFNTSSSMDDLAKSMIVQRGNSKSNFDDLGGTKETKADSQTNSTIDFLSNMED